MSSVDEVSAVVDTNLAVSGPLFKRGPPYQLIQAMYARRFISVYSDALLDEYRGVLARPHFAERYGLTPAEVAAFLIVITTSGRRVTPLRPLPVAVRDPKDEKVLAAALGGQADYLTTGDEDLLELAGNPKIGKLKIMSVREFLAVIAADKVGPV
jgi:putative PIN family toxin of toxin-antitoxin system